MSLREKLLRILLEPKVRPWALLTPLVVLLVALPLLRPLAAAGRMTTREHLLLDTVRSIVAGTGLKLDSAVWRGVEGTAVVNGDVYAAGPPTYAVLLAGPALALNKIGYPMDGHESLVAYVLTLVGVALPVAIGAGLLYRMGRLFELSRPRRALLATTCVLAGGWISYSTVLNPHAPAAAALVAACACLLYVAASRRPTHVAWLLVVAGLMAALAGAIDPWTLPLVLPLPLVVLSIRMPGRDRAVGLGLLLLGVIPIFWLHSAWSLGAFNSILPPASVATLVDVAGGADSSATPVERLADLLGRLFTVLLGRHGMFIHFPLLLMALVGMFAVLRRNWPTHAKMLAAITFVGAITIIMLVSTRDAMLDGQMFAVKWFIAFSPLLMFWLGPILRRPMKWQPRLALLSLGLIGTLLSVAGAREPLPVQRYTTMTGLGALQRWSSDGTAVEVDGTRFAKAKDILNVER